MTAMGITIKLTPRQRDLLMCDTYAEYPEGEKDVTLIDGVARGGDEGVQLRNELRAGKVVTVTPFLISELEEFADCDADPDEQRLYRRLLRIVKAVRA